MRIRGFYYYLFVLLFCSSLIISQTREITVSGFIYDSETGEELLGVNVYYPKLSIGTTSNEYGFYSLTIPAQKGELIFSYVGYNKKVIKIKGEKSVRRDIKLIPAAVKINEVVVEERRSDENVKSVDMGTDEISPKEVQNIPVILGEQDILKTIQLMPGISGAGEGNSGFYVRGGKVDQNLILLDEATVYNASHLLGFFSVFNSDAIKNVKIIKGNMPANYGGRLSSVLDIRMKEGNDKRWQFNGGLGLISSRLTLQGPIIKNRSSFLISGRRTYADLFLPLFDNDEFKGTRLYFYDLNTKMNYDITNNDRLYLSGYFGRDVFQFKDQFGFDWGNVTGTFRWNHIFSEKLFVNTSLIYSNYNYKVNIESGSNNFEISSGIEDVNFKSDFEYFADSDNNFRFGVNVFHHTFLPGQVESTSGSLNSKTVPHKYGFEIASYFLHEYQLSARLKINYGLRLSAYLNMGPGETYDFDSEGNPIDTLSYGNFELINSFWNLEPRVSMNFALDEEQSVKLSYARNVQYIHLLSNSTTSTPIDIWQPTTDIVKPELADQAAVGYFRNFMNNNYESSIEIYYKDMRNLVEYKNGADIFLNEFIEGELIFGRGYSYGIELSLKKNYGSFTGWLSYTLSKTERVFPEINNGTPFPARQDRRHDFSLTGIYTLNNNWTFSANWVFYTGDAVTFPSGKYIIDGNTINYYTERNGYRMPDYHRLDLGVTYYFKKSSSSEMSLAFSVYNAYSRKNAYAINFRESESNPNNTEAVRLSLFGIVPALTFNFRF